MTDTDPSIDKLWRDAVRRHLAAMPPREVAALLAEVQSAKPADPATPPYATQVRAAEETGDWQSAFDLKARQLHRLMNPPKKETDRGTA